MAHFGMGEGSKSHLSKRPAGSGADLDCHAPPQKWFTPGQVLVAHSALLPFVKALQEAEESADESANLPQLPSGALFSFGMFMVALLVQRSTLVLWSIFHFGEPNMDGFFPNQQMQPTLTGFGHGAPGGAADLEAAGAQGAPVPSEGGLRGWPRVGTR